MNPQPWSRRIDGLWLALKRGKVRHLYHSHVIGWRTECGQAFMPLEGESLIVDGERYDALPPCRACLRAVRRHRDWWQGVLDQQGAGAE